MLTGNSQSPRQPPVGAFALTESTEPVQPKTHGFMTYIDPALEQQVLDDPQTQRKANIHHHQQADHLRRRIELAKWARRLGHLAQLTATCPLGQLL